MVKKEVAAKAADAGNGKVLCAAALCAAALPRTKVATHRLAKAGRFHLLASEKGPRLAHQHLLQEAGRAVHTVHMEDAQVLSKDYQRDLGLFCIRRFAQFDAEIAKQGVVRREAVRFRGDLRH